MPERVEQTGSLRLNSDPREVDRLLDKLDSILGESELDEMSAFHLRCAAVEVVNNCIQHAYHDETGHPIKISYSLSPDRVQLLVSDQGTAFGGISESAVAGPMDMSGRGLEIINAWVSKLRFGQKNGWNVCLLEQRVDT
jgi:serine/threonine-protein kinase RsbW